MINIRIRTQPDDLTCGPTSLHAVYNYYGLDISLEKVIEEVRYLDEGGTLAVLLGIHALNNGFSATIYTYNLRVFDPTWFPLKSRQDAVAKIEHQLKYKRGKKFESACRAYTEFLKSGGEIKLEDMNIGLIDRFFRKDIPVIAGLSSTYLYNCAREYPSGERILYDDVRGYPAGHFVILCGFEENGKGVVIADPYKENPVSGDNYYIVDSDRLINSIMLGIVTYDANILIIEKEKGPRT